MLRSMCKSKIHRVTVTETHLRYEGSITIDTDLLEAADILPYEKVQVVNINNGARLETYVIPGKPGSGIVCMNGAAARCAQPGDILIVITYCWLDSAEAAKHQPKVVQVDSRNKAIGPS